MNDDIVTRLRTPWCDGRDNSIEVEAADEIERLRLACHYLAGWVSYDNPDVDPHTAVKVAYTKVARSE